jgi:hypothetical protein
VSAVNKPEFNCVFVSYSEKDRGFAEIFTRVLQEKLNEQLGESSIVVWMDRKLKKGKDWRREIQRKLNSTALVVVILSPDSIRSPWVLYEWHCSLLVQQTEPYLVHFRKCENDELNRFTDYQRGEPLARAQLNDDEAQQLWDEKRNEIDNTLEDITETLKNFSMLREQYAILTNRDINHTSQQKAAYELGAVPDGLKLAAANYLIEALQFWLSGDMYGYVGASIASALGRLGKRKAIPTLVQLFLAQAGQPDVLSAVERALYLLSCEEPV